MTGQSQTRSNDRPRWLRAYSRWTARVAVVALACAAVVLLALIPLHTNKGGAGAVWPLSKRFGHAHILADIGMLFVWIGVGIGLLIVFVRVVYGLLRRAEWAR